MRNALIFGGGGFIGTEFYRKFNEEFDRIDIIDKFDGPSHADLSNYSIICEIKRGQDRVFTSDVTGINKWPELLRDSTDIFILNADTGTGNSFLYPSHSLNENLGKLANLIELIRLHCNKSEVRIIFTSSRAVYGEGRWECEVHGLQLTNRSYENLLSGNFAPRCPICNMDLILKGSLEEDLCRPLSVYGLGKASAEQLLSLTLVNDGFDVRIVRFQNVYGVGQALDNPYTGVLNWFSKSLVNNENVNIYENGLIIRDFIFVSDAARLLNVIANHVRMPEEINTLMVVNGGSGVASSLHSTAILLRDLYDSRSEIFLTNEFRTGDVLGAVACTFRAESKLGFVVNVSIEKGLRLYANWFIKEYLK